MSIAENITIVTATIPEREDMLKDCIRSVKDQNMKSHEHIVLVDHNHKGCFHTFNRLTEMVETEFVQYLSDDNILYSNHIETVAPYTEENDIIYTHCDVEGRNISWNYPFSGNNLRKFNFINEPLIRVSCLREVGKFDSIAY